MKNLKKQKAISSKKNNVILKDLMKNKTYARKRNLFLLIISFTIIVQYGISQEYTSKQRGNFGYGVSGIIAADGYGTQFSPSFLYRSNRSVYIVGAIIQKQKINLSGAQFTYEYTLMKAKDNDLQRLELFGFLSGFYQANVLLGKNALWIENRSRPENTTDVSQLHFKSVEAYAGFGIRTKLPGNIQLVNCIGVGGYTSFDFPSHLYYARSNFGLILRTGISIILKNRLIDKRKN